jgi:hypothetical protein
VCQVALVLTSLGVAGRRSAGWTQVHGEHSEEGRWSVCWCMCVRSLLLQYPVLCSNPSLYRCLYTLSLACACYGLPHARRHRACGRLCVLAAASAPSKECTRAGVAGLTAESEGASPSAGMLTRPMCAQVAPNQQGELFAAQTWLWLLWLSVLHASSQHLAPPGNTSETVQCRDSALHRCRCGPPTGPPGGQ